MIHLHSRLALRRFALQPVPLRIESLVRKQARRKPESVGNFFAWRRISQTLSRNRNGVYGKLCVPVAAEARREFSKHEKKANSRRETGTRDSLKRREKKRWLTSIACEGVTSIKRYLQRLDLDTLLERTPVSESKRALFPRLLA